MKYFVLFVILLFILPTSINAQERVIETLPGHFQEVVAYWNVDCNLLLYNVLNDLCYPDHYLIPIGQIDVKRNNDPNRHLDYYHEYSFSFLKDQIDRGLPVIIFIDTGYPPQYHADTWTITKGYRITYDVNRYPALWREILIYDTDLRKWVWVMYRGCCGCDLYTDPPCDPPKPHNCENGAECFLVFVVIPKYFLFANQYKYFKDDNRCTFPDWCNHCDMNYDGMINLCDLNLLFQKYRERR